MMQSKLWHSITMLRGVRNTEHCFSHTCTISDQTSIRFRNKRKRENVLWWSLIETSMWSHQICYTFWASKLQEKVVIYFFLNDNQIYVTTKFMHSTQILVPVLAKKTFVCTLSESISNAVNTPPQK